MFFNFFLILGSPKIHLEITENSLGGLGARARFGGSGRPFSLEVAAFAPTKKFSEAPEALRACICAQAGRFCARTCSSERLWDVPNLDFGARDGCFFEVSPCAKHPTSTKPCKSQCETHFGASAHRSKIEAKSICRRFRFRLVTRTTSRASWELSQRLLERLWGCPGTHLDDSWPLFAHPGHP